MQGVWQKKIDRAWDGMYPDQSTELRGLSLYPMKLIPHPAFPEAIRRDRPITLDVETVLDGRKPWPEWSGYRIRVGPTDAVIDLGDEETRVVVKYLSGSNAWRGGQ